MGSHIHCCSDTNMVINTWESRLRVTSEPLSRALLALRLPLARLAFTLGFVRGRALALSRLPGAIRAHL